MEIEQMPESFLESSEEESCEDLSGSGSDFEVSINHKKRMKLTAPDNETLARKRPRRNMSEQSSSQGSSITPPASTPSPVQKGPSRRPKRQQQKRGEQREGRGAQHTADGSLYEAVKSGRSALGTVVSEWLESYKKEQEAGLLELINFLVQCSGCKGRVSKEMLLDMEKSDIICQLTQEFNEESSGYPLSLVGPEWRRFRESLCEFVCQLVRCCQHSLLYDSYLFSHVVQLLIVLADSQVRAFRHTSTFIAVKLMSAVIEVAVTLSSQIEVTKRRLGLEKNKDAKNRASQKVEELELSYNELLEQQSEVGSMVNAIMKGVFVHRYRDLVPEIRAVCIEELGRWLVSNPATYFNDSYLKYLGWMLYDKQPLVRLRSVKALQELYKEEAFISRLELFSGRFKERMLNMALDKDPEVAVEAVKLLVLINQNTESVLADEEQAKVYSMVFAAHRGRASAAGSFLYQILCKEVDGLVEERNGAFFSFLINFLINSQYNGRGEYLVDSLWDVAGVELRDWETMTSLLLRDTEDEEGERDKYETALIDLMMAAVRQAAEATPPERRTQGKKNLSMKEKKIQTQDRRRITAHFIPLLPQLLAKYSADVEKVKYLLRAPLSFDLDAYSSNTTKSLDRLLSLVCEIVEKHTDESVLTECARLSIALCSERYAFSSRAHRAFSQMLDTQVERFSAVHEALLQGTADEDDLYTATASLKRISVFVSSMDVSSWKLLDQCFALLKSTESFDSELMVHALACSAFHLLWEGKKMMEYDLTTTSNKAGVRRLKSELKTFFDVCRNCLSYEHAEVRDQAFLVLCDVLLVFCGDVMRQRPELKPLAMNPGDALHTELASFLMDYVFNGYDNNAGEDEDEDEEKDEEKYKEEQMRKMKALQLRRKQLSGYCNLILCGVLDFQAASDIFKHYSKFNKDYGDIIKWMLSRTKFICPVESAKTVCLSLQQTFSSMIEEQHTRQDFTELRELARLFAMSFGINPMLIRKPLLSFHQQGIHFALQGPQQEDAPPPNLAFLQVLSEFSFKLIQQDRMQLLEYVKDKAGPLKSQWLLMYQRSLQSGLSSVAQSPRAKRRRSTSATPGSVREGSWLGDSSISQMPTPALTSTVMRRGEAQLQHQDGDRNQDRNQAEGSFTSPAPGSQGAADSEDDFEESFLQRKTQSSRRRLAPSVSSESADVTSQLDLLSMIEEDREDNDIQEEEEEEEEEEPEIEEYEEYSDDDSVALPTNRFSSNPTSLETLFD
ncbi:cohesin subunit SA-1 isoform X2 [Engraulis encrasicolus]|uniref:cohesin subunit SA-1 isoform X2 n=1 Tax=Engraulis encrasicolus TaxID=184585 RepID=UPI002FCF0590